MKTQKQHRLMTISRKEMQIRYERGEPIAEIAVSARITEHGVRYHAWVNCWKRPRKAWVSKARVLFEQGATCRAIGQAVGVAGATVMAEASAHGWTRVRLSCAYCGAAVTPSKKKNSANKRVCRDCTAERYREKARRRTPEQRREMRRRQCERAGRPYRTRDQLDREREAATMGRPRSPFSELGRYRFYGEMPTSKPGLFLALRDTLTALLDFRCADAGITRETAQYRVRYAKDPAFRAKEKAKAAGRKASREAAMVRDGTLTPDVVRRLFATASTCPYCERLMARDDKTLDHITPVSLGGVHGISNVTVCCYSCNSRKHNMPFERWLSKLPPHIAARLAPARAA